MADTTHTLHLVAKLDTTEVQQKLNQLNQGRSHSSGSNSAAGASTGASAGASTLGTAAIGHQLQKSTMNLEATQRQTIKVLETSFRDIYKQMAAPAKNVVKQLDAESRKIMRELEKENAKWARSTVSYQQVKEHMDKLGKPMPAHLVSQKPPSVDEFVAYLSSKYARLIKSRATTLSEQLGISYKYTREMLANRLFGVSGLQFTSVIQKDMAENIVRQAKASQTKSSQATQAAAAQAAATQAAAAQAAATQAAAAKSPHQVPLHKNPLVRAGSVYLGSRVITGAGELLEASGYDRVGYGTKATGNVVSQAAMMSAMGSALGPKGALAGAVLGGAIGAIDELFAYFTKEAREAKAKLQQQLADITASNAMMRGWREEQRLEKIAGGSLAYASLEEEAARAEIDKINHRIKIEDWRTSDDLAKLLEDRATWQSRLQTAEGRAAYHIQQQEALGSLKEGAQDQLASLDWQKRMSSMEAWKAREHTEDIIDILRRMFSDSKGKAQEWQLKQRAALADVAHAVTPEEAQAYMKEASRAAAMQSMMSQQESWLKSSLVESLNQKLQNLGHVDTHAVTSLGQYGYNMGEKNDNVQRQLSLMQQQTDIQREIRDLVSGNEGGIDAVFQ